MAMQEQHKDESRIAGQKRFLKELLGGHDAPKRLFLTLICWLLLTCFLHFKELRMELPEVGAIAPRYVISQTDFDFLDEEASQMIRQETVRDIGMIYRVEESQVREFRRTLENSLIANQKWRSELKKSTFEEVYLLLDQIEEQLIQFRFTDDRTLRRMNRLQLPVRDFFNLSLSSSKAEELFLPKSFWEEMEIALVDVEQDSSETIQFLLAFFAKNKWRIQEDFSLQRSIRKQVQSQIPDRYTHVEAGTQILKKGEKVTPRHFSMMLAMKDTLARAQRSWTGLGLIANVVIAFCLLLSSLLYLYYFHRGFFKSTQKMLLLFILIVTGLLFAKGSEYFLLHEGQHWTELARFPLVLPLIALLSCVLISSDIAIISSLFLLFLFGVVLASDTVPFLIINSFASIVTIFLAKRLHKRKEVFTVLGKVWLAILPLIFAFNLLDNQFSFLNVLIDAGAMFIFLSISSLIAVGLLPILESLFEVMTDMTLMEYMDPDHELLRRLSIEAPGTYQHCLVVSNIADAAARAINANALFCRVSTLYHDIGKLFNPHYFTENQLGGFNIHQLLTPLESTQVIIAHVPEGEALARKSHLPQSFIDIIREHHGTTMVYYFYCKQIEQMGGDASKVNEKAFRYSGPKPRSKESAIIMIADTVEAASRSLDEVTEERMAEVIDKLVNEKAKDGQFDECQLTFEELGQVKKAIVKALMVTRHLRIKYPESRVKS